MSRGHTCNLSKKMNHIPIGSCLGGLGVLIVDHFIYFKVLAGVLFLSHLIMSNVSGSEKRFWPRLVFVFGMFHIFHIFLRLSGVLKCDPQLGSSWSVAPWENSKHLYGGINIIWSKINLSMLDSLKQSSTILKLNLRSSTKTSSKNYHSNKNSRTT